MNEDYLGGRPVGLNGSDWYMRMSLFSFFGEWLEDIDMDIAENACWSIPCDFIIALIAFLPAKPTPTTRKTKRNVSSSFSVGNIEERLFLFITPTEFAVLIVELRLGARGGGGGGGVNVTLLPSTSSSTIITNLKPDLTRLLLGSLANWLIHLSANNLLLKSLIQLKVMWWSTYYNL